MFNITVKAGEHDVAGSLCTALHWQLMQHAFRRF
jgi:hypothetical protein